MLSRKIKLKSLHVFMTMLLLLGLLQPSLALAADSTNVNDGNEEEIMEEVEMFEETEEAETPAETEDNTEEDVELSSSEENSTEDSEDQENE